MPLMFLQANNQDVALAAINKMNSRTFEILAIIGVSGVVLALIVYLAICAIKGNIPFIKKKGSDKKETAPKESSTPLIINNSIGLSSISDENTIEYIKNSLSKVFENWQNKNEALDEYNEELITSMKSEQVSRVLNKVISSYTQELEEESDDYDLMRKMFTLVITFDLNAILLEKLESLEKNHSASYSDTTSFIANACTDIVDRIKQRIEYYEIFKRNKEAKVALDNVFKECLPTLNKSFEDYLKYYLQKQDEWKASKQKALKEMNDDIVVELKHLIICANKGESN